MILTGHQPNYLPYPGFFYKIAQAEVFAIVDTVQFVKRGTFGYQNRAKIRTHQGWIWLTVPVLSKGRYHQIICETRINNRIPWQKKHWRSIKLNYQKAPYFDRYRDFFEKIYQRDWEYLADLNIEIIKYLIEALGIKVKIVKTSDFKPAGKGTDLIIDICQKLEADTYIHGKHGRDYVDQKRFQRANIRSIYQDFQHPEYKQQFEPFVPYMSVIDLIFNYGPESLDIILGKKKAGEQKPMGVVG